MTIKLRAPTGTTEANVGTHLYTADAKGDITVDPADAAALLATPGFILANVPNYVLAGYVRLLAPEGCSSCSVGGTPYLVQEDGSVIVPADHDLLSHGFKPSTEPVELVVDMSEHPADAVPEPAPEPEPETPPAPEPVVVEPETAAKAAEPVDEPTTPETVVAPVATPDAE